MQSMRQRINRVFRNTDVDAIFLMNTSNKDSNFVYLTGFTSGVFEDSMLIVTRKGMILPINILEYEIAMEQRPTEMRVIRVTSPEQMRSIIKKYRSKRIGINGSFLPYEYYRSLKRRAMPKRIIDVSKALSDARAIKDGSEISNIRIANSIAKKALSQARQELREGMTEKDVAARVNYLMTAMGASGPSFDTIVSFGRNAALPHHMPDNTKLKENAIVLIDMGAKYNNYCSDITRTFMFKPDENTNRYRRFIEMYATVMEAQKLSYKMIKNGVRSMDVHKAAADHIDKAHKGRYKGRFIHALGHPIGIEVHDAGPGLNLNPKDVLRSGMVVSDEPGIYIVGFGGVRIEDDILVTKTGAIMI